MATPTTTKKRFKNATANKKHPKNTYSNKTTSNNSDILHVSATNNNIFTSNKPNTTSISGTEWEANMAAARAFAAKRINREKKIIQDCNTTKKEILKLSKKEQNLQINVRKQEIKLKELVELKEAHATRTTTEYKHLMSKCNQKLEEIKTLLKMDCYKDKIVVTSSRKNIIKQEQVLKELKELRDANTAKIENEHKALKLKYKQMESRYNNLLRSSLQ